MEYGAKHVVTLTRSQGGWSIQAIAFKPEYKVFIPITQLPEDVPNETPDYPVGAPSAFTPAIFAAQGPQVLKGTASPAAVRGSSMASSPPAAGYNYSAMAKYAYKWRKGRNPQYPSFSPNDCANFVSQCLHAGGWEFTTNRVDPADDHYWFMWGRYDYSHSWTVAQSLRNFAYLSGRAYDLSSAWKLGQGDILGFDLAKHGGSPDGTLDHIEIAVAHNGGNPLMASHDYDYYGRPLAEILQGLAQQHYNWVLWPQRT